MASTPVKVWTRLLGTSGGDEARALTTGLDGSIYVTGYVAGSIDGLAFSGYTDAFLTKYSADGAKLWTRSLSTPGFDSSQSIATGTDGSIYISGYTPNSVDGQVLSGGFDAFLTKYNTDGSKAWTRLLGSSGQESTNALTTGLDGSIYMTGSTDGALDGQVNSGIPDAFLSKYSAGGTKIWTRLLGTSSYDEGLALTTGLDGSIYVSGSPRVTIVVASIEPRTRGRR